MMERQFTAVPPTLGKLQHSENWCNWSMVTKRCRLRWSGDVEYKDDGDWVKYCTMVEVDGTTQRTTEEELARWCLRRFDKFCSVLRGGTSLLQTKQETQVGNHLTQAQWENVRQNVFVRYQSVTNTAGNSSRQPSNAGSMWKRSSKRFCHIAAIILHLTTTVTFS